MKKSAEKALTKAKDQANEALSTANGAPPEVKDGGTAEVAGEVLVVVSRARKALEEQRKETIKPYREEIEEIDNGFKELTNSLGGREKALKKQLDDWEEAEERRIEAERQKAEEEATAKQVEEDERAREEGRESETVEPEEVEDVGALHVGTGTVGGTKTWTAEIEDLAAIPHEFLIDAIRENPKLQEALEVVLRAKAKKQKDKAKIPGVKFFQKRHRTIR